MGHVYAVEMNIPGHPFKPIKIGFSVNPVRRLDIYRSGPYPTEVLGLWEGSREEEREIHERYKAHRLQGEWFEPTPDLVAEIEGRTETLDPYECHVDDPNWESNLTPAQTEALRKLNQDAQRFETDPVYRAEQRALAARVMEAVVTR